MTMDAIIMMIITLVGYIGSFSYFMIRVFKKKKVKLRDKYPPGLMLEYTLIWEDIFMEILRYKK